MAYTYNKPDSTDTISSSQSILKDNFTAIKQLIDVNHVTFGLTDQGKHNFLEIPYSTVTPGSIPPATSSTEYALYSTSSGVFLRPPSQAAGTVTSDKNFSDPYLNSLLAATGFCILPCGVKMVWTTVSATYQATTSFTFSSATGFPGFSSTPYSVQMTLAYNASNHYAPYYRSLSTTTVSVYNPNANTVDCKILVMGV